MVYAVNTIGAVSGSLAAGFFFIPRFGLQPTLTVVSGCLIAAALVVIAWGPLSRNARIAGVLAAGAAVAMLVFSPPWDRALLASGVYMYAPYVPKDLDLRTLLKAGTLLYYREGAAATVSVKKLTGTTTLAVDGKVDASNRSDMLTQKMVAHLPLLLHDNPREVMIVGLGSGATVGSALRHPIARADVLEISPEVVAASSFFVAENYDALKDPRTNLIVGDGRSHLLLTNRKYDVIISEPSNPWIAGVAALFTREFFSGARDRLAAGGIMCQWANAYNISDADLRSIAATFTSVFPNGSVWLVGGDDVLFVGSEAPIDARLAGIERNWRRPGVADDLAKVSVLDPFSILSLYMGGPAELDRYAQGARAFSDDRMTLEFSAPRELHRRSGGENAATLGAMLEKDGGPDVVRRARATAGVVGMASPGTDDGQGRRAWRGLRRLRARAHDRPGRSRHARGFCEDGHGLAPQLRCAGVDQVADGGPAALGGCLGRRVEAARVDRITGRRDGSGAGGERSWRRCSLPRSSSSPPSTPMPATPCSSMPWSRACGRLRPTARPPSSTRPPPRFFMAARPKRSSWPGARSRSIRRLPRCTI